ncbi:MAG: chemotaxis protein CheC [Candidatus Bathyarchaeota archaeon]|nr:chemotaxis protein CheC [Candidatus Bathyarchaeota archaeon]
MSSQTDLKATTTTGQITENDDINLGILLELGSIGAGHAATSLSDVLQEPISIEVPKIHNVKPYLIPQFYNLHDVKTTAILLQLNDKYGCDILLTFEYTEARKIAAMMNMVSSVDELDQTMETSALQELANILIGSFLTSISDFAGVGLMPTTPQTVTDTFDAIIDNFLIKQSMVSDNALIFETRFKRNGEDAKSILMLFPTQELKDLLVEKSKAMAQV